MIENPCLKPACLSDVLGKLWPIEQPVRLKDRLGWGTKYRYADLHRLYDAEWKRRGYEKSP
jgi:hypothetical protein